MVDTVAAPLHLSLGTSKEVIWTDPVTLWVDGCESQKAAGAKKKKGALIDKPVTFHAQIKSSGYGSLKPWAPKTPKTPKSGGKAAAAGKAAGKGVAKLCPSYPVDGAAPTVFQVRELTLEFRWGFAFRRYRIPPSQVDKTALHRIGLVQRALVPSELREDSERPRQ